MKHVGRILVPTDLTEYSLAALDRALEIAQLFTTEIILLHAVSDREADGTVKSRHKEKKIIARLARA